MRKISDQNPVEGFYRELDFLSTRYGEITDTDVRDAIYLVINYFFIWNKERDDFPKTYYMSSKEADQAVGEAVYKLITELRSEPMYSSLPVGQARLDVIQDPDIKTPKGYMYDSFIGHSDTPLPSDTLPQDLFMEGEYQD